MLVVDLHCDQGHAFEGWFASGDELLRQQQAGLLGCPVCGSHAVQRRPSATRLNVSGAKGAGESVMEPPTQQAVEGQALQAAYLQVVRQVLSQTENVGERFADEARRIREILLEDYRSRHDRVSLVEWLPVEERIAAVLEAAGVDKRGT